MTDAHAHGGGFKINKVALSGAVGAVVEAAEYFGQELPLVREERAAFG